MRKNLPITLSYHWIEGHQLERYGHRHELSEEAYQNAQMDKIAKTHWSQQAQDPLADNHSISTYEWEVHWGHNGKLTSRILHQIRHKLQERNIRTWLNKPPGSANHP